MNQWSIFFRRLVFFEVILLVATLLLGATARSWVYEELLEQSLSKLRSSAELMVEIYQDDFPQEIDTGVVQEVNRLAERAGLRITLVTVEGRVLADSSSETTQGVQEMENHQERLEIVRAKSRGSGSSVRTSATMRADFIYYAVALFEKPDGEILEGKNSKQPVGYVRSSMPEAPLESTAAQVKRSVWLLGTVIGLLGIPVVALRTNRLVSPITSLTGAMQEVEEGHPAAKVEAPTSKELSALFNRFHEMQKAIDHREQQLSENLARHSTVLTGMAEGVIAVDNQERILFANEAAGRVLEFSLQDVRNQTLLEVVRDHQLRQVVQQVIRTQMPYRIDTQWRGSQERDLEIHGTPLPGEPCPGVVLVIDDVTAMKKLEGMRQQFVSNVSHELKTPLSSIKAYTETLLNGAIEDADNRVHFLQRIDEQADRLNQLIQDMLSLARIEAGRDMLEMKRIALAPLISRCVADYESYAQSKPVMLVNNAREMDVAVSADEESLRQVLSNLIDNALKYTPPEGEVRVNVQREGDRVMIEVADTGIGIAREHHERLFERFYRVDKARSRELGGTGLGLSIVKHLCQAMNGEITVRSELGKGSRFQVKLHVAST